MSAASDVYKRQALVQGDDEVMRACQLRGFFDLLVRGAQPAIADVLAHGTGEQVRGLQHYADTRLYTVQQAVSYTHLRAHETRHDLVCRLLLEKKKQTKQKQERHYHK